MKASHAWSRRFATLALGTTCDDIEAKVWLPPIGKEGVAALAHPHLARAGVSDHLQLSEPYGVLIVETKCGYE